jgi:hypothetical protein
MDGISGMSLVESLGGSRIHPQWSLCLRIRESKKGSEVFPQPSAIPRAAQWQTKAPAGWLSRKDSRIIRHGQMPVLPNGDSTVRQWSASLLGLL